MKESEKAEGAKGAQEAKEAKEAEEAWLLKFNICFFDKKGNVVGSLELPIDKSTSGDTRSSKHGRDEQILHSSQ